MFKSEFDMRAAGTWDESAQTVTETICPYKGTASYWSADFLRDGTGPPLIGALLALALAGNRMPWVFRN